MVVRGQDTKATFLASTFSARRPKWEAIVLKFPKISENFKIIERALRKYDKDHNDWIDFAELTPFLNMLGVQCDETIKALFESCDRTNRNKLNFKEVLVCIALGYVLKLFHEKSGNTENDSKVFKALESAFEISTLAFLSFDKDGSGQIDKDEVREKFGNKGRKRKLKTKRQSLASERMETLDLNKDGQVNFGEFLHGTFGRVADITCWFARILTLMVFTTHHPGFYNWVNIYDDGDDGD